MTKSGVVRSAFWLLKSRWDYMVLPENGFSKRSLIFAVKTKNDSEWRMGEMDICSHGRAEEFGVNF